MADITQLERGRAAARRARLQAGAATDPGPASPTSPSRSRSSRSWPAASPPSALGWNNGGPAAIAWGWPIISVFILIIGLCMSELVSAFPTSGGIYWWASKLGGAEGRLLHRLAQPDRAARDRRVGRLRLRDVLRPDRSSTFSTSWATHYSLTRVFLDLRGHPGARRARQHLLQPPAGDPQQHLGVVARRRCRRRRPDPALRARPPRERRRRSSPTRSTTPGFFGGNDQRRRLHLLRAAARGDPHPVHDHRLRRLGAPVRGDQERRQLGGQGHLAVDLLLRRSAAGSCCCRSCSRCRTRTASPRAAAASRVIFSQALTSNWAGTVLLISTAGQFFCTVACMTSTHPDAVRVQPRRRGARWPVLVAS